MIKEAKEFFYQKHYNEASDLFMELSMFYEAGLCKLLSNDPKCAGEIWHSVENPCTATKWGLIVLDLIELKHKETPGYFQIRGFLEVYINLFIENKLFKHADALVSAYKIFSSRNYESCKFIARALFAQGYYELALEFIEKSREICYPDPEGILIEAQCFLERGLYNKSLKSTIEVLKILPEYAPALDLRKKLLELSNA